MYTVVRDISVVNGISLSHAHTYTHSHTRVHKPTHSNTYTHTTLYTLNTTDAFHEYAVEFSSTHIAWALDGKVFQNISTKSECHNGNHQYVNACHYLFDPLM